MGRVREAWHRLRSFTRRDTIEGGLDEEIRFHLDQQTEKNLRAGMNRREARRLAVVAFGGPEPVKERARDEFRPALLEDSMRDI